MLIPNTLRKHRKLNNLKQEDVAIKLGLSSTDRISRWERGATYPHVINLFKLGLIYKVPPHELYIDLLEDLRKEIN